MGDYLKNFMEEVDRRLAAVELHYAAGEGNLAVVKALLEKGDDPNAFDDMGFAPLHYAVKKEQLEVVYELLKAGANVNAHDESQIGDTPLGAVAGNCSFEIADILVKHGADPSIKGWMQLSALDRARDRKKAEGKRVYDLLCQALKH